MNEDLERLSKELRQIADKIANMQAEEIKAQGPARKIFSYYIILACAVNPHFYGGWKNMSPNSGLNEKTSDIILHFYF